MTKKTRPSMLYASVATVALVAFGGLPPTSSADVTDTVLWDAPSILGEGISCDTPAGARNFRVADLTRGANYEAWILVEDDLFTPLPDYSKYFRIGWNNQIPMAREAQTISYEVIYGDTHVARSFTNTIGFTGTCGAIVERAEFDLLEPASLTVTIFFSGAQETIVDTKGVVHGFELRAQIERTWTLVATVLQSSASGSFSFGGSYHRSWNKETSISVTSLAKTYVGQVALTASPTVPIVRFDPVPFDPIPQALNCINYGLSPQEAAAPRPEGLMNWAEGEVDEIEETADEVLNGTDGEEFELGDPCVSSDA